MRSTRAIAGTSKFGSLGRFSVDVLGSAEGFDGVDPLPPVADGPGVGDAMKPGAPACTMAMKVFVAPAVE
ncbi:MAG TPA: hypothetical protein VKC82_09415 [Burkholderiales bacterium]|nr:hypothetical protein [Burkholderiales bacterium]